MLKPEFKFTGFKLNGNKLMVEVLLDLFGLGKYIRLYLNTRPNPSHPKKYGRQYRNQYRHTERFLAGEV